MGIEKSNQKDYVDIDNKKPHTREILERKKHKQRLQQRQRQRNDTNAKTNSYLADNASSKACRVAECAKVAATLPLSCIKASHGFSFERTKRFHNQSINIAFFS